MHFPPIHDHTQTLLVERYSMNRKLEWDAFVHGAKNATFLFCRDYMDYHKDRFRDFSLMIFHGHKMVSVLPANLAAADTLISHEGLTYGGLAVCQKATLSEVLSSFRAGLRYLHEQGIARLCYKRIPSFYNTLPDDEVAYALFILDARLYRRDCSMLIPQADRLRFQRRRRRGIKEAQLNNVRVVEDTNFAVFWEPVLVTRLAARHGVKPVHTLEEITLLAQRFPDHIRQFSAFYGDHIVAGATMYETPTVAHAQYSAVTEEGDRIGALDYLFGWLIEERYKEKRYFDFGICNENEGRVLNHGMVDWKEGYGARCCAHDFYEIATENYTKLDAVLSNPSESTGNPTNKN